MRNPNVGILLVASGRGADSRAIAGWVLLASGVLLALSRLGVLPPLGAIWPIFLVFVVAGVGLALRRH